MNRDELIHWLVDEIGDEERVMEGVLPTVVRFAADWIEDYGQVRHEILPIEASSMAMAWRDEMAAPRGDGGEETP